MTASISSSSSAVAILFALSRQLEPVVRLAVRAAKYDVSLALVIGHVQYVAFRALGLYGGEVHHFSEWQQRLLRLSAPQ